MPAKRKKETTDDITPQSAAIIKSRRETLKLDNLNNDNEGNGSASRNNVQPGSSHQDSVDLTNDDGQGRALLSKNNNTIKQERISTPESVLNQDLLITPWPSSYTLNSHFGSTTSRQPVGFFFTSKRNKTEELLNYFTRKLKQSRPVNLSDELVCQVIVENSRDEQLKSWARDTNCNDINSLYNYIIRRTAVDLSIPQ